MTSKSPVGDISVVTLIRTDTTLDHSQKAEKVWSSLLEIMVPWRAKDADDWLSLGCAEQLAFSAIVGACCVRAEVGDQGPRKNSNSHIDASHSRQPLVKGERLVRYEVNAVMHWYGAARRRRLREVARRRLELRALAATRPVHSVGAWR